MNGSIGTMGIIRRRVAAHLVIFAVVAVSFPDENSNAQTLLTTGRDAMTGAAPASGPASIQSTLLSRTGLHKLLLPGESTFDTLWFLPPVGARDPAIPLLMRIIHNATVQIDSISFPEARMLDISIIHAGYDDTLAHGLSNSGSDFRGTVFTDSAAVSIVDGTPPFTGEFAPARPLSPFMGRDATGSYIMQIFNHSAGTAGTLEGWGIAIDIATVFTSAGAGPAGTPDGYRLFQNFPNPFNPSTTIRYAIPRRSRVTLTIFDAPGRQIAALPAGEQEAGYHEVRLDGSNLASGVYFCRLTAGAFVAVNKLVLIR